MPIPSSIKNSFYSAITFFGTIIVLSVGYTLVGNLSTADKVGTGSWLTSASWNRIVDGVLDLNTRLSNLSFSGVNVGIGTANPGQKLSVAGMIESTVGGIKYPDGTVQTTNILTITSGNTVANVSCNGAFSASTSCPVGYTVSGCSAWTGAFFNTAGAMISWNGCQAGCGGGGTNSIQVQATCIKIQ